MAIVEQHGPADRSAVLWAMSQGAVVAMVVVALFWLLLIGAAMPSGGAGSAGDRSMTMCDRN
jgi:uncharacterized membrane protein